MGAKRNHTKNILLFSVAAGLLMSADKKGCEQTQQANEPRQLKKIVQMDDVRIAPLLLGNQEYDFAFQVNDELKIAIYKSNFYIYDRLPGQEQKLANGDDGFFNVQKMNDGREMLKTSPQTLGLTPASLKMVEKNNPHLLKAPVVIDTDVACLISRPQYDLALSVNSLEIKDGAHINIGFSQITNIPLTNLSFGIDRSIMNFSIHAWNGVSNKILASLSHSEPKNDYKAGFRVNLGGVADIGPEFYKKTGLQEVTQKGLRNTLNKMFNELKTQEWSSRVLLNDDGTIYFFGGQELNIKVGDRFTVYQSILLTDNGASVCKSNGPVHSEHKGKYKWIVEVTDVADGSSEAVVLNPHPDMNIEPGFKVVLDKRVEDIQAEAAKQNAKK